jgi:hypothetical protein
VSVPPPRGCVARWVLLVCLAWLAAAGAARAESLRLCDRPPPLDAAQQDRMLRFAGVVRAELEASGARVAILSRSGLDLARFGQRYSHAGISLLASRETPRAVRQLYFACEEQRPRLFDEGLAGFVLGTHDPDLGYVSIVLLPPDAARALEQVALDDRSALTLLAGTYSANAYPFSPRYQNCNQWVAEMLATAWRAEAPDDAQDLRGQAQRWLAEQGYVPTVFEADSRLMLALVTLFVPWLHRDDHPAEDLAHARYRVSMPSSLEAFVWQKMPEARRIEICHAGARVVVRRGWTAIADGCEPAVGDEVVRLE